MKLLALIAALALGGCNGGGDSPAGSLPTQGSLSPADLSPGQWSNYNGGITFTNANGGLSFQVPSDPNTGLNYLTTIMMQPLGGATLTATFKIDIAPGAGFDFAHDADKGCGAPSTRFYFQRLGDDWSGVGDMAYYRFYALPNVKLGSGSFTLSAPLNDVTQWVGIFNAASDNPALFAAAKAAPQRVGVVFGGGCTGLGHGVIATGGAIQYTLTSLSMK